MSKRYLSAVVMLIFVAVVAAACGTYAEPVPNSATLEAEAAAQAAEDTGDTEAETSEEVAVLPTPTLVPPTATLPQPTATLAPPTETLAPPTATEEPAMSQEYADIVVFVQFGDASRGETLFNSTNQVEMANGTLGEWACSTCHNIYGDDIGVGPGMLTLPNRASDRVEGMPAEVYIYNSIIHPNDYIVDSFSEGVMPVGYADVFTESELYDIAKYLSTLGQ